MKFEFHLTKVNSTTEIRLHYAPDERRFVLNEKGKIDPYSSAYRGKMLETFETLLYSSNSDKDLDKSDRNSYEFREEKTHSLNKVHSNDRSSSIKE